ncbi:MAG: formate dehydrogenase [Burkholderiales bacterium]|nr:formate dehydrogenase [Burkholderiales bacterium]MDE2299155.1 formate dehydrogenase [Burkholderiales bacterium]MDE2625573.1 formate dehydrogenase [Burkholderiales bacterium]
MSNKASPPNPSLVPQPLKRRGLLLGAGAAGAAVLAARAVPGAAPVVAPVVAAKAAIDSTAGYQLTPHVLRYYETARA